MAIIGTEPKSIFFTKPIRFENNRPKSIFFYQTYQVWKQPMHSLYHSFSKQPTAGGHYYFFKSRFAQSFCRVERKEKM